MKPRQRCLRHDSCGHNVLLMRLEVRFGLQIMAAGKRRSLLMQAFETLLDKIGRRVAPLDAPAAQQAGDLMAVRQKKGRPGDLRDTMIAGIALANMPRWQLATRRTLRMFRFPSLTPGLHELAVKEFISATELRDARGSCNHAASQSVASTRLALWDDKGALVTIPLPRQGVCRVALHTLQPLIENDRGPAGRSQASRTPPASRLARNRRPQTCSQR
jgi:predicted nucleic acid-binding protein